MVGVDAQYKATNFMEYFKNTHTLAVQITMLLSPVHGFRFSSFYERWMLHSNIEKKSAASRIRTYAGEPIWFLVRRLNHSAIAALQGYPELNKCSLPTSFSPFT